MPATPRWLLAVPDAIRQLETLDRDLLTRRDVERLFGVSRARAAQLMRTFGAAHAPGGRAPPGAAHRGSIRVAVPIEALEARLAGLPEGVTVEAGRIEVRFRGAQDAVGRLFALAQALTHDYEQFEALVEEGDAGRGGGAGRA